jgi:CubicO group peptidase (beta-lactamase class C family)
MKKFVIPVSLLLAFLPAFSFSQGPVLSPADYGPAEKDLEKFITDRMMDDHVKGLSVALVDGPQIVWMKGFGMADVENRIPATADTLYYIGGPSKIFTAAEVMKLSEEGKIGLDRPLSKYVRDFSIHSRFKKAKAITVRSLLANHSGLPGFYLRGIWVDQPESLQDFTADLRNDYLVAPPQTLYKYSYVDYDLLGRMVEIQRHEPFAQALREDLFEPLGMENSTFEATPELEKRMAKGYRKGETAAQNHLRDVPAAGMVSSARDMAKFLQFVLGGSAPGDAPPLKSRTLEAMFEPQYEGNPLDFGRQVGMGWILSGLKVDGSEGTAWHDGVYPPFVSEFVALNQEKLGVVFLSNSAEAEQLSDDVAIRALKLMLQAKFGVKAELKKPKIEMPPLVEVPQEKLNQYAGAYSALGQVSQVTPKDGHLQIEMWGHQLDLLPISQDTFVPHIVFLFLFPIDLPQYPLTFSSLQGQDVAVLGGLTYPVPLQKIQPVEIPKAWKDREGEYVLENPDGVVDFGKITLMEKDGFLTTDMKVTFKVFGIKDREFKVAILPLSDEDGMVPGLFYGDGGTLHAVDEDGTTRVLYSGYWFKKKEAKSPETK